MRKKLIENEHHEAAKELELPDHDTIYDVKFCPFLPPEADPIIALTTGQNVSLLIPSPSIFYS